LTVLAGWWALDDALSVNRSVAQDSSGFARDGLVLNQASFVRDARVGVSALQLQAGLEQSVSLPSVAAAFGETRALWLKTRSTSAMCLLCLSRSDGIATSELRLLRGVPMFYVFNGLESYALSPFTPIPALNDGVWHHIAFVRSGVSVELFVDGESIAAGRTTLTQNALDALYPRLSTVSIGRRNVVAGSPQLYFEGVVDDVRYYQGPISAELALSLCKWGVGACVYIYIFI
jgi:hypothetical protein